MTPEHFHTERERFTHTHTHTLSRLEVHTSEKGVLHGSSDDDDDDEEEEQREGVATYPREYR